MQEGVLYDWSSKATIPPFLASSKKRACQEDVFSSLNNVMNAVSHEPGTLAVAGLLAKSFANLRCNECLIDWEQALRATAGSKVFARYKPSTSLFGALVLPRFDWQLYAVVFKVVRWPVFTRAFHYNLLVVLAVFLTLDIHLTRHLVSTLGASITLFRFWRGTVPLFNSCSSRIDVGSHSRRYIICISGTGRSGHAEG